MYELGKFYKVNKETFHITLQSTCPIEITRFYLHPDSKAPMAELKVYEKKGSKDVKVSFGISVDYLMEGGKLLPFE